MSLVGFTAMSETEVESHAKKQSSKEALRRAAEQLFIQKGYDAVSTREIAELAEVNLGGIQYHFGSKANLFIETVRTMMVGSGCVHARIALLEGVKSREDAAQKVSEFIYSLLTYLLRPEGNQPCRLMFRELLASTNENSEIGEALLSNVVREFSKPTHEALISVLAIINSDLSDKELSKCASSIMGQCFFYFTHRPFLERIKNLDFSKSPAFEECAEHISRFSLMGLGCDSTFINSVTDRVFKRVA